MLDLNEGDVVLDVCANYELNLFIFQRLLDLEGKVYAYDSDEQRIKIVKSDSSRNSLNNIILKKKDAKIDNYPISKKILVDVPCTGTGVLGKTRYYGDEIHVILMMSQLQFQILQNMSKFLEIGGIIIYSTCSLLKRKKIGMLLSYFKI